MKKSFEELQELTEQRGIQLEKASKIFKLLVEIDVRKRI